MAEVRAIIVNRVGVIFYWMSSYSLTIGFELATNKQGYQDQNPT